MNAPQPDFGTAWSCISDITTPAVMVGGFMVVLQAVARRWLTDRGSLIDDPTYGYNLTDCISDDMDTGALAVRAQGAAAEARKDSRVLACSCTLTLENGLLRVVGVLRTGKGPFKFVVGISQVSPPFLQVSP